MKREYASEDKHHHSNSTILSNLHHQNHNFHLHPPPSTPPHLRHPSAISEEADSHHSHSLSPPHHSAKRTNPNDDSPFPPPPPNHDGATIEVVRRPRGRPPGSKNKPKPPVIITRDSSEPSMSPYVLELPAGVDVVESTARFCRRRNMGLCVLNGNGVVANVTIKQPSTTSVGATVTFHGHFDILSLSATILPGGGLPAVNGAFTISLAGPQGQVVGGHVVGPLVAAGTIYLIAASFNSPSFERLRQEHEDAAARGGGHEQGESPKAVSGGDSGGAPVYNYQPPASDVVWAPTARQPQPPHTQPY